MKKFSIVSLLAVLLTSYSCADQDTPEKPQGNWGQSGQQGTCNEECPKQECPRLECNGEECPSCPSCPSCPTCEVCKVCQNGGECDTSALNIEISRLQRDLNTQKDATEECLGDLDTCTNDLKTSKVKTIKSGSRLIPYKYVGEDGSQWPSLSVFDSKNNLFCPLTKFSNWSEFGCTDQLYCVSTSKYQSIEDYIDRNLYSASTSPYYPTLSAYCNSMYSDSYDDIILNNFGSKIISGASIQHYEGEYYTDSSCSSLLTNPFIIDSYCVYDMKTIFSERKAVSTSEHEVQKICIDNSVISYISTTTDYKYFYYKPKEPKFYDKDKFYYGSNCYGSYSVKNAILLEEIPNIDDEIAKARRNRESFCRQLCAAINKEAVEEDWAKVNLVPVD